MNKTTLVVMAAGMGSRYGGLKQIDPVGPNGEIIMDYSIFDAIKAGFSKVVIIIKKDNEEVFREVIGKRIEKQIDIDYSFQEIDDLPEGYKVPEDRVKPWGTAHAVMSCRKQVDTPFAVINADDFYGRITFEKLQNYLAYAKDCNGVYDYCMVGFILENTLTEHGHVARGICSVDHEGYLQTIKERTKIKKFGNITKYTENDMDWIKIPKGSMVSMNTWGFTLSILKEIEDRFTQFLDASKDNKDKAEYYLPSVIDALINEGKARVKVLKTDTCWYGVTYPEDKPMVKEAIAGFVEEGIYPPNLRG